MNTTKILQYLETYNFHGNIITFCLRFADVKVAPPGFLVVDLCFGVVTGVVGAAVPAVLC